MFLEEEAKGNVYWETLIIYIYKRRREGEEFELVIFILLGIVSID